MDTTTNERLNDTHEWQTVYDPSGVKMTQSTLRRLHRLHARVEFAQEIMQAAQAQFQEALLGIFEDAGIEASAQDGFHIDWRASTLSLRRGEEASG
jgi:hypothetical protein